MEIMQFTFMDWGIVGLVALSVAVGAMRGFVREALSLVLWVLAFLAAFYYSDNLSVHFSSHIHSENLAYALAFTSIFVAILIVGGAFNHFFAKLVHKAGLRSVDRILGLVFGFLRGVIVVAIVILLLRATPVAKESWWESSKLRPHFGLLVDWVYELVPSSVKKHLQAHFEQEMNESAPASDATPASKPEQLSLSDATENIGLSSNESADSLVSSTLNFEE